MADDGLLARAAEGICAKLGLSFVGKVGEGAFKETYEVRSDAGARALKVYKPAGINDRIEREVAAMKRCNHPNVVKLELLAVGDFDGVSYVYSLEEFLDGGSLDDRMADGPLAAAEVAGIAVQLADAVEHIAGHGLVHRDLKPANIMFRSSDGAPVVVDFGLVRDLDASSLTKTFLPRGPGTPYFAPPEQLNNEKHLIDWRADQFSLGVLLSVAGGCDHPYAEEDDQPVMVVERVASRTGPAQRFVDWANGAGIPAVVRMVAPWPVRRYRRPEDLASAWQRREG